LDEFEEAINAYAAEVIPDEELVARLELEAELQADEITTDLATALGMMEPFGTGNPEPLFLTRGLAVRQRVRVGDGTHLKLEVTSDGLAPISCIAFGMGDACDEIQIGSGIDLCYSLRLNDFNGASPAQLVVCDMRSA
jgi:single-stranded-DNA-specific exonuclease